MAFGNFQSQTLRRNLIPAAVAVVLGGIAWVGIGPLLSDDEEEAAPPQAQAVPTPAPAAAPPPEPEVPKAPPPAILVANRDIPAGSMLDAEWVEWRDQTDPVDITVAVVRNIVPLRAVVGGVTRRDFGAGELIAWDGLLLPGHPGFISAALQPGLVAVTVEVDRATTDARIIYPGDRVDVIMMSTSDAPASHTIVRDSRILAVGAEVLTLGRYGRVSLTEAGQIVPVDPPQGNTYTLEVPPTDAERIAVASTAGRLTLAMRPIRAPAARRPDGTPVRLDDVLPPPEGPEEPATVRIIRGAEAAVEWTEKA